MEFWLSFIFGSLQGWLCISTFIISGCTWFLSFLLLVMLTLLGGRADPDGQNISVLDSNKCQLSQLSWWLSSVKASEVQKHCPQQWHQNRFFLTSVRGSVLGVCLIFFRVQSSSSKLWVCRMKISRRHLGVCDVDHVFINIGSQPQDWLEFTIGVETHWSTPGSSLCVWRQEPE